MLSEHIVDVGGHASACVEKTKYLPDHREMLFPYDNRIAVLIDLSEGALHYIRGDIPDFLTCHVQLGILGRQFIVRWHVHSLDGWLVSLLSAAVW